MKIKVAILDSNTNYLNRFTLAFTNKFSDKIEIHSFTNQDAAMSSLISDRIDVLLASDDFEINISAIPKRSGFAYLVDSSGIEMYKEQKAISRFQKAEVIYKEILGVYSEVVSNIGGKALTDEKADIISFFSTSGGVGSSSVAVAYAKKLAMMGEKTLYLNLEQLGNSDVFFSGEGVSNFSEVIYSLKSKKSNLALKLESFLKEDPSGVNFFSATRTALDMLEIKGEDIDSLFNGIDVIGGYQYVIVDADFSMSKGTFKLFGLSQSIIFVSDGSEIANDKFARAQQAFQLYEQQHDVSFLNKASLLYNKFSNKTSKAISNVEIREIGGIPRFEHATVNQVIDQLVKHTIMDSIMQQRG